MRERRGERENEFFFFDDNCVVFSSPLFTFSLPTLLFFSPFPKNNFRRRAVLSFLLPYFPFPFSLPSSFFSLNSHLHHTQKITFEEGLCCLFLHLQPLKKKEREKGGRGKRERKEKIFVLCDGL